MKRKIVVVLVLTVIFMMSFATLSFASSDELRKVANGEIVRYTQFEQAEANISISNGIATVGALITPNSNIMLSYAVMTIELIKFSSGTTIQSWYGTYYPNATGCISFSDTQALYATGGYYVRVSGTVYQTNGEHEVFSATSGIATY